MAICPESCFNREIGITKVEAVGICEVCATTTVIEDSNDRGYYSHRNPPNVRHYVC